MREFNITGSIVPEKHYYVDVSAQLDALLDLVEKEKYFVINRPRQCGKTTMLHFLRQRLKDTNSYAPAMLSFEIFAQWPDITEADFYGKIANLIVEDVKSAEVNSFPRKLARSTINNREAFFNWLRRLCQSLPKKLVLFIDEVDAVPETVVIGFLANLRAMYLERQSKPAPHSIAIAGVHDIKNLKARYRDETRSIGSASPFNIAIDYHLPPFSLENIRQYYSEHAHETGQEFEEAVFSRVHHVTNGHPWLVSVLAKTMVEELVINRDEKISLAHAEAAIQKLVTSRNANFESLYRNAHKPEILPLVLDVLTGRKRAFNIHADPIDLGVRYGVFAEAEQQLVLGNLIYAQVLYMHFKEELEVEIGGVLELIESNRLHDSSGRLDFPRVLEKFQAFMKAKGATLIEHPTFKEATAQLLFLSYLDLLINGKGWTFKEVPSGRGRIDVLCCYGQQKEVVELKLWYGARRYSEGLDQLAQYLESENLKRGYLLVFDRRKKKSRIRKASAHRVQGKRISAWVV